MAEIMTPYRCPLCGKPMVVQRVLERCWCPNKCLEALVLAEKKEREAELKERR